MSKLLLLCFLVVFLAAEASHFRFATINWRPLGGNAVRFTVQTAWRTGYYGTVNINQVILAAGGDGNTMFNYGDGTNVRLSCNVTSKDTTSDWFVGFMVVDHTYPSPINPATNSSWIAYFQDNTRIDTLKNNADKPYRSETSIDLRIPNSSPVVSSFPIVFASKESAFVYSIPAYDPDGDILTFSLGAAQCGAGFVQPPNFNLTNGTINWNVTGLAVGLWTTCLLVSDGKTTVSFDFILSLSDTVKVCSNSCPAGTAGRTCLTDSTCCGVGTCLSNASPFFVSPTPASGDVIHSVMNTPFTLKIFGADADTNDTVSILFGDLPVGAATSFTTAPNAGVGTLNWTPPRAQIGPFQLCFTAIDKYNRAVVGGQRCVTLLVHYGFSVGMLPPPSAGNSSFFNMDVYVYNTDATTLENCTLATNLRDGLELLISSSDSLVCNATGALTTDCVAASIYQEVGQGFKLRLRSTINGTIWTSIRCSTWDVEQPNATATPVLLLVSSLFGMTSIPTAGGNITISGQSLGLKTDQVVVQIGEVNCTGVSVITNNTALSCNLAEGTGTGQIVQIWKNGRTIVVDKTSPFSYQKPQVANVSSVDINGGLITLSGANFGTNSSLVNVVIDSQKIPTTCGSVEILVPHFQVVCVLPPGFGKNLDVKVTVDGLASNLSSSATFSYDFTCDGNADVVNSTCSSSVARRTLQFDAKITQTNYFAWRSNCSGNLGQQNSRRPSISVDDPCVEQCSTQVDICRHSPCTAANVDATCTSLVSIEPCSAVDTSAAVISLTAATPTSCEQNATSGSITWNGFKFATSYQYCVGTAEDECGVTGGWKNSTGSSAAAMLPVTQPTAYYARVKGANCGGISSAVVALYNLTKTITVPMPSASSVSVFMPAIFCAQQEAFINVLWKNFFAFSSISIPATNFHVCVDVAGSGSNCSVYEEATNATSASVQLSVGTNYTVRVSGENCRGEGPYSELYVPIVPTACCLNNCSNVGGCYQNQCFCPPSRQGTDCSTVIYPPVIQAVAPIRITEMQKFTFAPTLVQGSQPIKWSLVSAPSGLSHNSTTGEITWLNPQASVTPYQIQLRAANNLSSVDVVIPLCVDPSYYARVSVDAFSRSFLVSEIPTGVLLSGYAAYVNISKGFAKNVPVRVWIDRGGFTQIISTTTDSLGRFQIYFMDATSGGSFLVGCSHPFYFNGTVQDTFKVFGISAVPSLPHVDVSFSSETNFTGLVTLRNLGTDTTTNLVLVTPLQSNGGTTVLASLNGTSIAGSGSIKMSFKVTTETQVAIPLQTFKFNITATSSNRTISTSVSLQITAQPLKPVLSFSPAVLTGAVSKYGQAVIPFTLANSGLVPSGSLQVQVPKGQTWISMASSPFISSVEAGTSVSLSLLLNPGNVTEIGSYSGSLLVLGAANNASSSALLSVPFKFSISSNLTGTLSVTAVDEFTYYAEGAPKVANSTLSLRLLSGTYTASHISASGIFNLQLNEGYYEVGVTADGHAGYMATVHIVPGQTQAITAFMQRTMVSYSWSVTPTTVEDEYTFTLQSVFQTYVPAPVIVITPNKIDWENQIPDEDGVYTFYFNITNYGYIAAQHAAFDFSAGTSNGFFFKSDLDGAPVDIPGLSSRIVVVKAIPIESPTTSTTGVPLTTSHSTSGQTGVPTGSSTNSGNSDSDTTSGSGTSEETSTGSTGSTGPTGQPGTGAPTSTGGTAGPTTTGNSPTTGSTTGGGVVVRKPCFVLYLIYDIECDGPKYYRIPLNFLGNKCGPQITPRPSGYVGGGGTCCSGSGYVGPTYYVAQPRQCDPCLLNLMKSVFKCSIQFVPYVGPAFGFYSDLVDAAGDVADASGNVQPGDLLGSFIMKQLGNAIKDQTGFSPEDFNKRAYALRESSKLGNLREKFDEITTCIEILEDVPCLFNSNNRRRAGDPIVAGQLFLGSLRDASALQDYLDYFFLYPEFYDCNSTASCIRLQLFLYDWSNVISDTSALGRKISMVEADSILSNPDRLPAVDSSKVIELLEHWNRSMNYYEANIFLSTSVPNNQNPRFLSFDGYALVSQRYEQSITNAAGYAGVEGALQTRMQDLDASLQNPPEGVCAKVTMQIKQDAVVTRSAFEAVLEIENESAQDLTDLSVAIQIKDVDGVDVTLQFVIGDPTPSGSMVLDPDTGNGSVAADSTGKNSWLMIPLNDLVNGSDSEVFYVGGVMTYTLGNNQLEIPLFPVVITVYPSPIFYIDYFHQAEVYSDDPFTPEIEPSEPFVIGVMIRNLGYGSSPGFKLTSGQPVIVENEKGLTVQFQIVETRLGNKPVSPSLTLDFGELLPGSTSIAQFFLTSTLSGDFISFNVSFEYVSPLGDSRLCQLENLDIHELVHPVQYDVEGLDDALIDFLLNDVPDVDHLPDKVWLSNGTILDVDSFQFGTDNTTTGGTDAQPTLNITAQTGNRKRQSASCNYYQIADPFNLTLGVPAVLRSDNTPLKIPENVWRTHRKFYGQNYTVIENLLHIFDCTPISTPVGYVIHFAPVSQNVTLAVLSVTSHTILIGFSSMDPAIIKWNVHYKLSSSSTWTQIAGNYPGNTFAVNGLTRFTDYDFAVYPGRTDGYSPLPTTTTGKTLSGCVVNCPAGKGVLDAQTCECECAGSWLGDDCSACGLTSCPTGRVPNYSSCECDCPTCPPNSAPNPLTCACNCVGRWIGTACNQCGMLPEECPEGQILNTQTCGCQCAILCQNGGIPSANPSLCECDCVGNWTGTLCADEFVRPFTTGIFNPGSTGTTLTSTSGSIFTSTSTGEGEQLSGSSSNTQTTTIIAAVVGTGGGFVFFGTLVGAVVFCRRRRRRPMDLPICEGEDIDLRLLSDSSVEMTPLAPVQLKAVDFRIDYGELVVGKKIGSGNFGAVFAGQWRGTEVAVKKILEDKMSEKDIQDFERELNLMKNLRPHRNVLSLFGYCTEPLCIVTEYCASGSLDSLLKSDQVFSERRIFKYVKGIAAGMFHLHAENIIHRDLAARNVLIHDKDVKVADFGMSRVNRTESNHTITNFGPIRWMSPESLNDLVYGFKTDVYSFGVVLFEILVRKNPFEDMPVEQVAIEVGGKRLSLLQFVPTDNLYPVVLREIMKDCLDFNPDQRPDFLEILNRLK